MPQNLRLASVNQMALANRPGADSNAYNEAAFRHFLRMERKRAERSRRSLLLLLVDLQADGGTDDEQAPVSRLLPALARCVRQVDVVGWYRAERVAGAVLTHEGAGGRVDAPSVIARRVADELRAEIPSRVRVRVFHLRAHE